ncbi:MAG: DUF4956 domain-containing protein [Acidimicrobiia bacterium]|nr:DUF4956 domain-containing protein [Acidimicrobiia bacterium]
MSLSILILIDVVAILILTFGLYWPRHRRKNMVVAYLTANIGVAAVASVLASSSINAGLGLGLFGILSIIRLRSDELDHTDIAYYFGALALGLFAGLGGSLTWATPVMTAAILAALYIGDHPELFPRYRNQVVTLDAAYTDEAALVERLEGLLNATVHRLTVRKVDLVNDTTVVEVRYELPPSEAGRALVAARASSNGSPR